MRNNLIRVPLTPNNSHTVLRILNKEIAKKDVINELDSIENELLTKENLSENSVENLYNSICKLQSLSLKLRYILNEKEYENKDKTYFETYDDSYLKELPVTVSIIDNILRVHTPLLFNIRKVGNKKSYKDALEFSNFLQAAFYKIQLEDSNFIEKLSEINPPFVIVIERVSTKFNPSLHCDNDNIETSRIINTVFSFLGHSDNPVNSDFYSFFKSTDNDEEIGMNLYVVPKKNFSDFYLNKVL